MIDQGCGRRVRAGITIFWFLVGHGKCLGDLPANLQNIPGVLRDCPWGDVVGWDRGNDVVGIGTG